MATTRAAYSSSSSVMTRTNSFIRPPVSQPARPRAGKTNLRIVPRRRGFVSRTGDMNRHGLLRYVCPLPAGCQGVTIGSFSSARSNVLTDLDLISFTVHRHFDDVVDIFIWSSYLR